MNLRDFFFTEGTVVLLDNAYVNALCNFAMQTDRFKAVINSFRRNPAMYLFYISGFKKAYIYTGFLV